MAAEVDVVVFEEQEFVTADGKELPLTGEPAADNIERPSNPGQDYYGGPIKIAGVPYATAFAAQPLDGKRPARLRFALAGKQAVRFKATLGGDYPFGDESQRRKVYGIRTQGAEARFLTVLEPYEMRPVVRAATATGPDTLRVELADGRVQEITIRNLDGTGNDISVTIRESRGGGVLRTETTARTPTLRQVARGA